MADSSPGERTQSPTPRRIEQARGEGQIALSRELVAGVVVASAFVVLVAGAGAGMGGLVAYVRTAFAGAVSANSIVEAGRLGFDVLLSTVLLPIGVICAAAVVASVAQTRGNFAPARLQADGARVWPRASRLLGREGVIAAAMDVCRLIPLCVAAYLGLLPWLHVLPSLSGAPPGRVVDAMGFLAQRLGTGLAIVMVGLGFANYLWQVVRHRSRLRMTQDEARRDARESEGVPELRDARRRMHRALGVGIEEGALDNCALVVTDPGALAAALSYSGSVKDVPVLLAKGNRLLARKLEEAARTAAVPVVEHPSLAAALVLLEEGREIPELLYEAVAEAMVKSRGVFDDDS